VKEELAKIGFVAEFHRCEIDSGDDQVWKGVQFKYFQSNTYFIPAIQWAVDPTALDKAAE